MNNLNIEIIPVKYGKSHLPENLVFLGGSSDKHYAIDFIVYVLKINEKIILIDAGCETMPGFVMTDFVGSIKALEKIGITAEMVNDVIISHSHHDHIECVKYFKKAVIHIQKDEFEDGKQYIPEGFEVNIFDDRYQVCDGVEIIKIGGHTKGSCIVEINGNIVYVGDECYIRNCITEKIPTGATLRVEKSKEFIEKYSDSKYTLLFAHDR